MKTVEFWISQNKLQINLFGFLIFVLISCSVFGFGMEAVMAMSEVLRPSGVLYFSNGASIEKFDLKTRKREEIIPWLDHEGKSKSNSTFPVYSSKENKMYFFRSYVWPVRYQLVAFDLEIQKEEDIQNLDHYIEALSPDEQWFAYFQGGGFIDLQSREVKPVRLIVHGRMGRREKEIVADVSPYRYRQTPIWVSNEELLYRNLSEHVTRVNILNNEKRDMGLKGLEPCAVSPDRKKVIMIERGKNGGSKIYLFNLEQEKLELIKEFSYFTPQGPSAFIWSPDGKSFIYTRHSWSNMLPFNEVGNLYWYNLTDRKDIKLADKVALAGGFWLAEDPAIAQTEKGRER